MIQHSNNPETSNIRTRDTKKCLGNYYGIVVQNNDPDHRGRIKVYIPHINVSLYGNWDRVIKDKKFKFVGHNVDSDLTNVIDELKQMLPWAECAAPLVGTVGSGRYNAYTETGTVSDSNSPEATTPKPPDVPWWEVRGGYASAEEAIGAGEKPPTKLNADGVGEKPARIYEVGDLKIHDAFDSTTNEDGKTTGRPNAVNKYSYNYVPTSHSNEAKGSFSIPNVGSHVWVFFEQGDHMKPVYFAATHGREDWNQIYQSSEEVHGTDYPGSYENKSLVDDPAYNHNTEVYRNKFVLNQKGGTLEIVNTDNREILKMTHYSGSFKEFNNEASIEFATNNDQKLVLGDQFETIRGAKNMFVANDYDNIIRGDCYRKIGTFNVEKYKEWQEHVRSLADIKQLFEVKRTSYADGGAYQKQSPGQQQSGTHAPCPLCSRPTGRPYYWEIQNKPLNGLIMIGIATVVPISLMKFVKPLISAALGKDGVYELNTVPSNPGNFLGSGPCPVCNGSGLSPSTFEGEFDSQKKDDLLSQKLNHMISDLAEIEKELGMGGSEIVTISKHKVENIGLLFNDFPSIRVDEVGKITNNEVKVFKEGVVTTMATSPLVEYVHVDDLPGGTYSLTANNRFNCTVGAGGIHFKSYGPVDIGGTITNIGGQQVNIASENEINIKAGKRINIVAEILTLRNSKYKQVLVDSNLGVSQNVIIGGGLHVEGEVSLHHVTAPMEMQETESTTVYGQPTGTLIGYAVGVHGPHHSGHFLKVYGLPVPMSVQSYPHTHLFKNLPLSLTQTSNDVRTMGKACEGKFKIPPTPVEHDTKGGGLFEIGESLDMAGDVGGIAEGAA